MALLLASSASCAKKSDTSTAQWPVRITFSAARAVANGINALTVSVTDPAGGPIILTTDRGHFQGGATTATITGAAGTVALITCDAATDPSCPGIVHVNAAGAGTANTATATFGTMASICASDCSADPGCATLACTISSGGTGACSGTTPSACVAGAACTPNPAGATTETSCTDGIDNDCNGKIDGADTACEGQPCVAGSSAKYWKSGVCTDITSGLGIKLTPTRTRLPTDGLSTTTVVVDVSSGTTPLAGVSVSASTTLGTLLPATALSGADGKATFTFTASATSGVATITALLTATPSVTQSALLTMPRLGSFRFTTSPGSVQNPVMGAKGSAWNETSWLQLQVLDDAGNPYPDGLVVRFEHRTLGGSTLLLPAAATSACPATTCVAHLAQVSSGSGAPDSAGLASATITSGRTAGTLVVNATATADGVNIFAPLPTMAVIGAKASAANFSLVCSPRNLPALAETDCSISLVDAPFTCEAILKDRFSNVLGTATQVIFVSEAAAIGQVATTPAYDPTQGGSGQMDLGIALQGFNTLGSGLPFDVTPASGEPSVADPVGWDGCGPRTRNPRDGLVTIIAIADGEEALNDLNGNGIQDAGEAFIDQGEPYVDQNDNGQYDPGEWFLDVDGNGAYTPPNGMWDANTKIWTQTVVLYTTGAASIVTGAGALGTRWADLPLASACTPTAPATPFDVGTAPVTTATYAVIASDLNLNFLTSGATYAAALEGTADLTVAYRGLASYADELGFFYRYWPCANGGTGTCAAQCQATGGPFPCLMKPTVASYSCGVTSTASITGGAAAVTSAAVDWNVNVPWDVYGSSRLQHGGGVLRGSSH